MYETIDIAPDNSGVIRFARQVLAQSAPGSESARAAAAILDEYTSAIVTAATAAGLTLAANDIDLTSGEPTIDGMDAFEWIRLVDGIDD